MSIYKRILCWILVLCLTAGKSTFSQTCNNWLFTPNQPSYVSVGDMDISGNKLTIEALCNPILDNNGYGDLVSKHKTESDCNYLLRLYGAGITTSNGFFSAIPPCRVQPNRVYHAAMVYDGAHLKFYRNGVLLAQTAASGNLVLNDWETWIGYFNPQTENENFTGYINEVRIWNVARTQEELKASMTNALSNPTAQNGLLAYYTFDNLLNKQGNAAWNGRLGGAAQINQISPSCNITTEVCTLAPPATAGFTAPDTVCVNEPIVVQNTSVNASNYFWNFCSGGSFSTPTGVNLGNPGGMLAYPVFSDIVEDNGEFYLFVSNNWPGGLIRLDFGNSLLNTPTPVSLGTVSGVVFNTIQSLQVVKNEGKWYVIMVGGHSSSGITSRVVKVELGTNITNPSPTGTNWGNLGNLAYPVDLHLFQEGNRWYGLTLNAENATLTRFDFTNSFNNTPTGQNLGNPGGNFSYPTGIYAVKENNSWHVFVTNDEPNPNLIRLDFGNSLLNTPTPVNLGNPNGALNKTRDIVFLKECGLTTAFAVNGATYDQLVRLEFGNDLLSRPKGVNLGNIGNFNFPHSISKFFRVGSDMYTFVTNVYSNSITRLRFGGCSNSSVPNSSASTPPPFSYNTPGIYTVTQTIDIGLPTQSVTCRTIVVVDKLPHLPVKNISICAGDSIKLGSSSNTGNFAWSNGSSDDSVFISTAGYHWVETQRFNCSNRDSFLVTINPAPDVKLGNDTLICDVATLVLDAGNPGASFLWNTGSSNQTITVNSPGEYSVTVTAAGCSRKDTVQVGIFDLASGDFTFIQDVCDGRSVTYAAQIPGYSTIDWDFGDGSTESGVGAPLHHYTAFGTYNVIMRVSYNGCQSIINKRVVIGMEKEPLLVITPDTTICFNSTKMLRAAKGLSYCWYPADFLDDPSSASPVTSATQDITYYLHTQMLGANVVTNGDFSQGNTGFASDYNFTITNNGPGEFGIAATPVSWSAGMNGVCRDHSSGTGSMLLVNGAAIANAVVWKQTVTVTPFTNYAFSAWVQTITSTNAANLRFAVNGRLIDQPIIGSSEQCSWNQYFITWTAGDITKAEIAVVNMNTIVGGNGFALDDISFAEVFLRRDSVKISVERPLVTANADTIVCTGQPVQLIAGGAQQYFWSPSTALNDSGVSDPVANPIVATEYIVTGTTAAGCIAKDTVVVNIFPGAAVSVHADTAICRNTSLPVWASGGVSYQWSPAFSVNNPSAANPIVSPVANTMYHVLVTDINSCKYEDSVKVDIIPDPVFTINAPITACLNDTVILRSTGGDTYVWSPTTGMNDPFLASPSAAPGTSVSYSVTITEKNCNQSATLQTRITVLPLPDVHAAKSNDIDCSYGQSVLNARGARSYTWTPTTQLSNALSHSPVAFPKTTTTYVVAGTDRAGCTNFDSVTVLVNKGNPSGYLMPSAFTPNNDGLNDCYGVKYWGMVNSMEFSVFDRWGVRVFYSRDPSACWDGTYKGEKQPAGVYVYMVKARTDCEDPVFKKGTFVLIR